MGIAAGAGAAAAGTAAAAGGGAAAAGGLSALGYAGLAASAAGALTSAAGSYESGQSAKAQAEYQSQIAAQNQVLANQNATQAIAAGEATAEQAAIKQRADTGQIRAAEGASGVDVNSGSALDVQSSQSERDMLDQLIVRSNAERTAYGYKTQGLQFGGQAALEKAAAEQAPVAGDIGAVGSIFSGASGVANQDASWQRLAGGVKPLMSS